MKSSTLVALVWLYAIANILGVNPVHGWANLFVFAALGLLAYRAADREIDAAITQQYTGNTTPGAKS